MFRRTTFDALIVAFALVAMALIAYFGFFGFRDNFAMYFPLRAVAMDIMRGGEIPYWNFQMGGGTPLAGNPNSLTFYPLNLLTLFLPAHVAFNLHFLVHIAIGVLAMRALCIARGTSKEAANFAAAVYMLSGVVVSTTALYNLIVYIAMIPVALLAIERRSTRLLGLAFGLMLLAPEPVIIIGALIVVAISAWRRFPIRSLMMSVLIASIIAIPQIIAFMEISGDIDRTAGMDPGNVLGTALTPMRVAEIFVWPLSNSLMDAGGTTAERGRLFSTIFIGVIALPALWRRSRFVAAALLLLFLAIKNPIVVDAVLRFEWLRVGRYPEKFVIPFTIVVVMLIAEYFDRTRMRKAWVAITLIPLVWATIRHVPIDWYAPYRIAPVAPKRVFVRPDPRNGVLPSRIEYRQRAQAMDPLFGMPAGISYLMLPSPDRLGSRLTRIVLSRFHNGPKENQPRYLQIAGAAVPNALPDAMVVPRAIGAASVHDAVRIVESPQFDPHRFAVAPSEFVSAPGRVTHFARDGQTIHIDVETQGVALVFVNQTYYGSWVATMNDEELPIVSLDIDRLGVLVPQSGRITLRFGRYRAAIAVAFVLSLLLVLALLVGEIVEKRNRRAGEVERAGDDDVPLRRV